MSQRKRVADISIKQVVSSGILFGMIMLPFIALSREFADKIGPRGSSDPISLEHVPIYGAICLLGCALAWATPNSTAAWSNGSRLSARQMTSLLFGYGVSGILMKVINGNWAGVPSVLIATLIVWTIGALLLALGRALYGRKQST